MLQVLGRASSINVRKVLWTCAELGLAPEHIEWGAGELSLASSEYRALNPNGLVPVLRDGPVTLWESNTICRYLAARERRTDLLPDDPLGRARVEQWMDWQATELNTAWRYAFMALVRRSAAHRDPAAIDASAVAWNRHMVILDAALAGAGPFVSGAVFTLADVVLGLVVHRWR
ncbi:MAG: glutathione S-transferase, partial [Burkholderiaceae bacterium]